MFIEAKDCTLINLDHVICIQKKRSTGNKAMYVIGVIYVIHTGGSLRTDVIVDNCTVQQADAILADIKKHIANPSIRIIEKYQSPEPDKPKQPSRHHDEQQVQDIPRHEPEPGDPKESSRDANCSVHYKRLYNDEKALLQHNPRVDYPSTHQKHASEYNTDAETLFVRNHNRYTRLAEELNTSAIIAAILVNLDFLFTEGDLFVTSILTILLSRFADVVKAEEVGLDGYGRDYVYKLKPEIKRKLSQG